jgi:hypothetical protein
MPVGRTLKLVLVALLDPLGHGAVLGRVSLEGVIGRLPARLLGALELRYHRTRCSFMSFMLTMSGPSSVP